MSPEAWSALANWVMAGAAVAAAFAAIKGINSWKSQNAWLLERESARSAMRALLRLASELSEARRPEYMRFSFGRSEVTGFTQPHTHELYRAHVGSIENVQQAFRDFETAMFDLEYLGDTELRLAKDDIDLLTSRYLAQTDIYLRWKHREFPLADTNFFASTQHREDNYEVVFDDFLNRVSKEEFEHNDFTRKFDIAVKGLERKLARRLSGDQ